MAKSPCIPLYYNDLRGATQDWNDEEFGAYVRLLIYQWDKGFIPNDLLRLNRIAESTSKNWPVLCQKFTPGENGFLRNSVMEKIRAKRISFLNHQSENGKLSAKKRWGNNQMDNQKITKPITKKKPLEKENEIEIEIENKDKGVQGEKDFLKMPFTSENFEILWQNWKKYRLQEFGSKYKSMQSEQAALLHLAKISGGIEGTATEIISQSIGNQWQGLFELKNSSNGINENKSRSIKKVTGTELNQVFAKRYPQRG